MAKLILIRHGQTDWNVEGRWQGQLDPPLNERGRGQAYLVSIELAEQNITALYSSDLRRSMETAQIVGSKIGVEVVPDPRLREINLGVWQGMLSTDIQSQYPREFHEWRNSLPGVRPPGGESILALANRVLPAVNEIIARHPQEGIGIVAHEFPIALIVCRAMEMDLGRIRESFPAQERGR